MVLEIPEKYTKIRHMIEKKYRADMTFRETYNDYLAYRKACRFWIHDNSDDAPARRIEYAELLAELEEELMQMLNAGEFVIE